MEMIAEGCVHCKPASHKNSLLVIKKLDNPRKLLRKRAIDPYRVGREPKYLTDHLLV
jgi:hypothetical protein